MGLRQGHLSIGKTGILDRFLDLYEHWLTEHGRSHEPAAFRQWVAEGYRGGWCQATIEEFRPLYHPPAPALGTEGIGGEWGNRFPPLVSGGVGGVWRAGEPLGFQVRVRNTTQSTWSLRPGTLAGMHLGYQIWDGNVMIQEGRAGQFRRDVAPGEHVDITLAIPPLAKAGRYRLLVDMVEERHCWFFQAGSEPHEEELVVGE
jgi:hypothetical protein